MSSQITRYENLNHKSKHLFAILENMCYLLATLSANIQIELIRTLYFVFYSYRRQMLTSILYLCSMDLLCRLCIYVFRREIYTMYTAPLPLNSAMPYEFA